MSKIKRIAQMLFLSVFTTLLVGTISPLAVVQTPFKDVSPYHVYAPEIQYMKDEGISYGFNNGTEYRPDINIERQTLVTLIVKAKYSETEINSCIKNNGFEGKNIFNDVPSTHHFAPFICMAKVHQIAVGYSTGDFGDTRPTKAHEAIKMIMRTLDQYLDLPINAPLEDYTQRLYDFEFYPPTINKQNEDKHETTRGEIAYIIQIIRDNYIPIGTEPFITLLSYTGTGYTIYYPNFYEVLDEPDMERFYQPTNATIDDNGIGLMIENNFVWGQDFSQSECQIMGQEVANASAGSLLTSQYKDNGRLQECSIKYTYPGNFLVLQRWIADTDSSKTYIFLIGYSQDSSTDEIQLLNDALIQSRVNI